MLQIFNKLINKYEYSLNRRKLTSKPVCLDIVLTRRCNLKCIFCKNYETEGQQDISIDDFRSMTRSLLPYASMVSFCSGGEPYLNKDLMPILDICKEYRLYVWLLSNGMIISEDVIRQIVKQGLVSEHGFSIDAASKEKLEQIRVGADFGKIISTIEKFISIKNKLNKKKPSIHIKYTIMRRNIEDLEAAIHLFDKLGVDKISVNHVSICNDMDEHESLFYHQGLTDSIFRDINALKDLKIKIELPRTDIKIAKALKCRYPWYFLMIDTDGSILPCYKSFGYLKMGNMLSSKNNALFQYWNSRDYQELRQTVNDESSAPFYPYCHKCEVRYPEFNLSSLLGQKHFIEVMDAYDKDIKSLDWRR